MKNPLDLLKSVGPAIVVAAVVLGPGSILTSSKVGATYGFPAVGVVALATILMIAMVALAARIGVIYERTPCGELANRLGRPVSILIGVVLFTLVAFFQSSNNIAVVGGVEPLIGIETVLWVRILIIVLINGFIIASLYLTRDLYKWVERMMKLLIGMMVLAFVANFIVILIRGRDFTPQKVEITPDVFALLGMIGTTFSVGGAFFQAYLVKQRGWGIGDAKRGVIDSAVSISVLGLVTAIILMTAAFVYHGDTNQAKLDNVLGANASVGTVANQLRGAFGGAAVGIFSIGILAGALSSILVNAMIGGTVLSDSLGKGHKVEQAWPRHLTTVALVVGAAVAIAAFINKDSTVHLITIAQACTVIGLPVLSAALIYLGTRSDLTGDRKVPKWILAIAVIGFIVACGLAYKLSLAVWGRLFPAAEEIALFLP